METIRETQKAAKFPKTALAFYIKIYCKQKGSSKTKFQSNLVEATKSWLSLSESEKQQVVTKYKDSKYKFKLQCFDQLKNAEPFMKAKDDGVNHMDLNTNDTIIQEKQIEEVRPLREMEEVEHAHNNDEIPLSIEDDLITETRLEQNSDESNQIITEPLDSNEQNTRTFLVEPLAPTLRTGKDLFHMLNSMDPSISWTTLQPSERNQYGRAVYMLKKDYIAKYREYLESLTPRELFDYYNKTIF